MKTVKLRYKNWKLAKVINYDSRQTIRRAGKACVGDNLEHCDDSGSCFATDACVNATDVLLKDRRRWIVNGEEITLAMRHKLAQADGFANAFQLADFIRDTYGYPFHGVILQW